ncbi:MAG: DUF692 domain-containing protein [Pseudomonadota bacterium]
MTLKHPKTSLPARAGVCLKHRHYDTILAEQPDVGWFEVHAENYLGAGGKPLDVLAWIRERYALSVHGVGLSIGSHAGLDARHLARVAALVERMAPHSFSEHLAWSTHDNRFYSDLLPVPYNRETEDTICAHINQVQDTLKRQMLLENPSNYLSLDTSTLSESELLSNIVKRTGCGLLLDVNNVYISAQNMGYSAADYIRSLPLDAVGEIHLAGHDVDTSDPDDPLLIDTHDREVCDAVWALYAFTLEHCGPTPTLIEWDSQVPDWDTLCADMKQAEILIDRTEPRDRAIA